MVYCIIPHYITSKVFDCRAVGSNFPLVRWVIELGRPILENVCGARKAREVRLLGGSGGMPPPGKFWIFGPSEIVSSAILV